MGDRQPSIAAGVAAEEAAVTDMLWGQVTGAIPPDGIDDDDCLPSLLVDEDFFAAQRLAAPATTAAEPRCRGGRCPARSRLCGRCEGGRDLGGVSAGGGGTAAGPLHAATVSWTCIYSLPPQRRAVAEAPTDYSFSAAGALSLGSGPAGASFLPLPPLG